jgi:hypothetical protein
MDIDSINAGTVDTKGWLNPTVGTLRAKKIICDDIEGGGGIPTVANLGWNSLFPPQAPEIVSSGQGLLLNTSISPSASVPAAELVPGSVWEIYATGVISPNAPSGVLGIGINFNTSTPTSALFGVACIATYTNTLNSTAQYEYHGTFRVLTYTDNISLTVATVGSLVTRRSDGATQTDLDTFQATASAPIVNGRISVILCAGADGADFGVTRRLAYLRRIA